MRLLIVSLLTVLYPVAALAQAQPTLRFSGNVGFRVEYMANENFAESAGVADDDHRIRFRVRTRLAAQYQASDLISAGFRVSTGSGNFPSSEWSSLNDLLNRDEFRLDRAFVRITPHEQLELRFGLDQNAAFKTSEMVWDDDVAPGGLTQIVTVGAVRLVAGQYMLREVRSSRPTDQENSFLLINGLSVAQGPLQVGAYHYFYSRADAVAAALDGGSLDGEFKTNRFQPTDPADYFSNFSIVQFAARVTSGKWRVGAEAAINLDANSDASLGPAYADKENIAAGGLIRYGDHGTPWGWSLEAGYFQIQADAVIAVYNSDDFQQTNVHTIPVWFRLRLPGGAALVWDTYIQRKVNENLASNGGVVHNENATKVRTRVTVQVNY